MYRANTVEEGGGEIARHPRNTNPTTPIHMTPLTHWMSLPMTPIRFTEAGFEPTFNLWSSPLTSVCMTVEPT
jgi:hypothetical protein